MESQKTVLELLTNYLVEAVGVSPEQLANPGLKLDDLGLDSLGLAELLFEVEERFGISVSDSGDMEAITSMTLNETVEFLEKLIEASKAVKPAESDINPLLDGSQHAIA
jgi:acyl carrier protein